MTAYRYTALDAYGKRRRGVCQASDETALARQLAQQGLELLLAQAVNTEQAYSRLFARHGRNHSPGLKRAQLMMVCMQLAQLCEAGVPILHALSELANEDQASTQSQVLQQLQHAVASGQLLSQAMQAQTAAFPSWVVHLVAAAEYSGRLPEILRQIAHTLQWQQTLRAQLLQGLLYPCLLLVVVLAATVTMLTVLVPQMASFLQSMGQTLPWTTRALLGVSDWLTEGALWCLPSVAVCLAGLGWWLRTSPARLLQAQHLCCACPLLGKLLQWWLLSGLCRMLALLYQSGVPLMQALTLCENMLPLLLARRALQEVTQYVQAGHPLADSLAKVGWFPALMVRMIRTGEQSGGLDHSLCQLGDWYTQALQTHLQWMLRMLEPLFTLLLGVLLLFLMMAVIMPVYDSFNTLGQPYGH